MRMTTGPLLSLALLASAVPAAAPLAAQAVQNPAPAGNPIIRDKFTADPAPLVVGDRLYLYVGHDQAEPGEMFNMREWLVYSTADMQSWTDHGPIMQRSDFAWSKQDAWAAQAIEKDGRFWFYATVEHDDTKPGKAIGVAVSDSPTGPFVDARGSALISNDMTPKGTHSWEDIDPTVFTDEDGTTWIVWGNRQAYIARLKPNMIEIDGPIREITPPHFEEGPWLHERDGLYYLTYASLDRETHTDERVSYATATSLDGEWTYRGELTGSAVNSFTIHPGIARFKGQWYIFLHNASLAIGDREGALGRRAVTVEYLQYDDDGLLKPVVQTDEGVSVPPPAAGQGDRMVPIAAPAQPDAIPLGTGPLPGAQNSESWHRQYGSEFARNVTDATLTPFLPDPARATGAAVIVAPGGGFRTLSMSNEGWEVARALADRGVAAFVLKYRLNQTPADMAGFERSMAEMFSGASSRRPDQRGAEVILAPQIADANAAFALIRSRADEWNVDPDRVGMIGFSAGAMLTLMTTLTSDDADPAFIGNIYGPLFQTKVPDDAPPMFAALAADDPLFGNSGFGLIESWRAANRPVEFHLYEQGGHGFGMYPKETTSTGWFDAFASWLAMRGLALDGPTAGSK